MKRVSKIVLLVTIMMIFMVACGKEDKKETNDSPNIIWGTELVNIDVNSIVNQRRGFNMPFAYKEKKDEIQFVNASGINVEALSIEVVDDTLDVFKEVEYNGYKFGYLGIQYKLLECKNVKIDEIIIKINGKEEKIVFEDPIIVNGKLDSEPFVEYVTSDAMFSGINQPLRYSISCLEKVTITGYGFSGPFILKDSTVSVNGVESNVIDVAFDIDDEIVFDVVCDIDEKYQYGSLSGDFYIEYVDENNESCTYYFPLVQQGVGDEFDAEAVMKQMVGSK